MPSAIEHRTIPVNGIDMSVMVAGDGPLVVLCHGWPELSHSWRHQVAALAAVGYRAAAPDMRGYGRTSAPESVADYTIFHLVGDIVGLVHALGESRAAIVGHDWGAPVAWHCAMFRPDMFPAVAGLSVPARARGTGRPLEHLRRVGLENFYWLYFQTEAAEREFERDVAATIRRLLFSGSGDVPRGPGRGKGMALMVDPGGGFLDHTVDPETLPAWIPQADLDHVVGEYQRTGFRGGLNWYRNIDRNWELTAPWAEARIEQPALFIAGTRDAVIRGPLGEKALAEMDRMVPNLTRRVLVEGAGHWIQQERPDEVNAALIEFLAAHGRGTAGRASRSTA